MPRMSQDDQIRFLLICVKHAHNGRVNFEAVVEETDVVSKGAAAKRYERMVKDYGIKDSNSFWDTARSPRERIEGPRKPMRSTKKRKFEDSCFNSFADEEDDDDFDQPPDRKKPEQKPRIKREPMSNAPMNYPSYMYQQMMPPYPQYVQRPIQSFITPNSGLHPAFSPTNFQMNQLQQPQANYTYQMSPQLSPFTTPNPMGNTQRSSFNRNQDNTDDYFHNNASTFGNFEALMNDSTAHLNGTLLGDEYGQPLQDLKPPVQIDNKQATPIVKVEPIPEMSYPELPRLNGTTTAHEGTSIEENESILATDIGTNTKQPVPINNVQAHVKQEDLDTSILISD